MHSNTLRLAWAAFVRPLLPAMGLAFALGSGGCATVDEAASFDDIEEDSDGAEEDDDTRFRVMQDTCGDDPHGGGPPVLCAQQCHNDYHFVCLDDPTDELRDRCRESVEQTLGYPCDEELNQAVIPPGGCSGLERSCRNGQIHPQHRAVYDAAAAICHQERLACLADC
ncbi:MAG: hypothetical protein AAF799_34040 [Myxococcota bacterium]